MVAKTSIYYDIVTEFQNKGAKQAQQSMGLLEKSANSLGKKLAATFGAAALLKFGKDAVHMAAEENKQFTILGNTLNNLGLGFASVNSKAFIENLALASGVAIDTLIPAYQQLLVATGDVTLSQKDLAIAMDVSIATGKELSAVTTAISKGYLGNTTALSRLGAGLDKALLKTGDMNAIMLKLSSTFAGSTTAAADTSAGAIARLTEATRQATVQIGDGLIGAFTSLTAGGSLTNAINDIVKFGTTIGNAIAEIGDLIAAVKRMPIVGTILSSVFKNLFTDNPLFKGITLLAKLKTDKNAPSAVSAGELTGQSMLATQAQAKVTAQRLADAKSTANILANTKKTTAELKLQNQLKILGDPSTNLQKAELLAALQKDISQAARDQLNIQLDLLNATTETGAALQKSIDDATILTEKTWIAQGKVMLIDGSIVDLATAKNPFAGFDQYVQDALNAILKLNQAIVTLPQPFVGFTGANNYGGLAGNSGTYGFGNPTTTVSPTDGSSTTGFVGNNNYGGLGGSTGFSNASYTTSSINLNLSLEPGIIVSTTNASTANGSPLSINRLSNQFASV
jgi:hypothetical protein